MEFAIFLAGYFRKISLKFFEQEMRKIFEMFFTKNHKTMSYDFSKSIQKICGHLREKLKWPLVRVFYVDLKQMLKKNLNKK